MSCEHPRQPKPWRLDVRMSCAWPDCSEGVPYHMLQMMEPPAATAAWGSPPDPDFKVKARTFERERVDGYAYLWAEKERG